MTDIIDKAQQLAMDHAETSLRRHQSVHPLRPGLTACERSDCREPIRSERTAQGARLCDECQVEHDKRNAHFAVWARPR